MYLKVSKGSAISVFVIVLFLMLSMHEQIEHSCFVHSPFSVFSTPLRYCPDTTKTGHRHDHRGGKHTDQSHSQGSRPGSNHDSESHIHPSEFTQSNTPNSIQFLLVFGVIPIPTIVSERSEPFSLLKRTSHSGPAPPLYLLSSALLI